MVSGKILKKRFVASSTVPRFAPSEGFSDVDAYWTMERFY